MLELMKARHSVRQYTNQPIEQEKREVLNTLVERLNQEHGLHVQICYDESECFDSAMAHYGKFEGVQNYISLTGPKGGTLDETCGYAGEELVLKAQELGLNTCWVALTHGKSKAEVAKGEKEVCLITLGYGKTQGHARKSKTPEEVSNVTAASPEWFKVGVEAALLAPTAVNQQKFYFTLEGDKVTGAVKGIGALTKMDLGIVKYHFEAATGRKVL